MKKKKEYKTPRNEFHAYLQRVNKATVEKDKSKEIPRKRKYKQDELAHYDALER